MDIEKIAYDNQLKGIEFRDIPFNQIRFDKIPAPYYKDYSHHKSAIARNYISYDTMGFRDILLSQLSQALKEKVLKLIIITPKETGLPYDAFAYLSNKEIVAIHFENTGNFKQWMDIIFKDEYEKLEEYRANGQFERQAELNPTPQFMFISGKGQFSIKWVNSGMLVDEKPYENTGRYLYKKAPQQYNEARITREKRNYIKKHIDTSGVDLDSTQLKNLFIEFLNTKNLQPNPPQNNEAIYKEFEALAGYEFPEELKILFTVHNGMDDTGFLTAEQVLQEWKNWKEIYDDVNWMLIDLTGNSHADGRKTIGIYTNPYWIPFLSTGGGNFIAIDYAPGSKGKSGQIIAFGADERKIRFIAAHMQDLLQQIIDERDVLNNGFEK